MAAGLSVVVAELGVTVVFAAGAGMLVRSLKLPPLLGYVLAGVALSALSSIFLQGGGSIAGASQLGLTLLLFLVGLELNWSQAKAQLRSALLVGTLQLIGSIAIGSVLALTTGLPLVAGLMVGLALSFSSTVVVIKILSEGRELNSLHGRMAVSILLVQDLVAVLALVLIAGTTNASSLPVSIELVLLFVKAASLLVVAFISSRYLLPWLFEKLARVPELLFLASLGWCFAWSLGTYALGLPIEVGALIAGLTLAPLPYSLDIVTRIRVLRDFFVVLLFVNIGITATFPTTGADLNMILLLSLIVVLIRPLITFIAFSAVGYRNKPAFFTALTQGQLSEFSLILISLAVSSSLVPHAISGAIATVALITMVTATLMYAARQHLFRLFSKSLKVFERGHHAHGSLILGDTGKATPLSGHIVLFGYHRMGYHIVKNIKKLGKQVVVIDYNPDIVKKLRDAGVEALYGDIQDEELYEAANVSGASLVISTVPHREETEFLISRCKTISKKLPVIVVAHRADDASHYYKLGARYVLLPYQLGGEHIAELIGKYEADDLEAFMSARAEDVRLLNSRKSKLYAD